MRRFILFYRVFIGNLWCSRLAFFSSLLLAATITASGLPDLQFGYVTLVPVSSTADRAEYSLVLDVTNGGSAPSPETWVQLFIGPEPGAAIPEQRVSTAQIPLLEAGATSARLSLTVFLEPGAPLTNYLTARIDAEGAVEESDESNNDRVWQIFGPAPAPDQPKPDWAFFDSRITRRSAKPGGQVTAVVRLANLSQAGVGSGFVMVGCYLHPRGADPSAGTKIAEFPLNVVAPNQAGPEWRFACTIPPNQPLGFYECTMRVDPDNTLPEAVETNNDSASFWFDVTSADSYPDLLAYATLSAPFGAGGEEVASSVEVICYAAPSPCPAPSSSLRAYLLNGSASTMLAQTVVPAFDAPGRKIIPLNWIVPNDVPPGHYTIACRIDEEDFVTEYWEQNETRQTFQILAAPMADLAFSGTTIETIYQTVALGGSALVQFKIKNLGSAPVPATKLWFHFSDVASNLAPGTRVKEIDLPPIPARGETESMRIEVPIPLGTIPGSYYLTAIADGPNDVLELNETDSSNRHVCNVTVIERPLPDLVLEGWVEPNPFGSNIFTLHYTAKNQGIGPAPASEVHVFLRKLGDTASPPFASFAVPPLEAGASFSGDYKAIVPPSFYAGRYFLQAAVDGPSAIEEVSESNNAHFGAGVELYGPLENNSPAYINFQANMGARYFTIELPEGQRHLTVQCSTNGVLLHLRDSTGQQYSTNGAIRIENPAAGVWMIQAMSTLPHPNVTLVATFAPPEGSDAGSGLVVNSPSIGAPPGAGAPACASDGTQFLGMWAVNEAGIWTLVARRFDANGEGSETRFTVRQSTEALSQPLLASNGDNYLAVWQEGGRVRGAIVDPVKLSAGAAFDISAQGPHRLQVCVASNGSDYLVAWFDGRGVYSDYVAQYTLGPVRAALVTSSGAVPQPNGMVVYELPNRQILEGRKALGLASASGRFMLVWEEDWHMAEGGLHGAVLAGDGSVLRPAFQIAGANAWQGNAGVTAMGDQFVAYWTLQPDNANRSRHLKFALRLSSSGTPLDLSPRRICANYDGEIYNISVLDGAPVIFFAAGDRLVARAGSADLDFVAAPIEVTSTLFGPFAIASSSRRGLVCWPAGVASIQPSGTPPVIVPTINPSVSLVAVPGAANPTLIDPGMRFIAEAGIALGGSVLTVSVDGGMAAQLSLAISSSGETTVSVNGSSVVANGQPVAEFFGGAGGAPLELRFLAAAAPATVQAVLRSLVCNVSGPLLEMTRPIYWQQAPAHVPTRLTFRFRTGDGAATEPFDIVAAVRPAVLAYPAIVAGTGGAFPQALYDFVVSGTVPMRWLWRLNGGRVVQTFTNLFQGGPRNWAGDVYGGYTVIVENVAGRKAVGPIAFLPGATELPGSDHFAGRPGLSGSSGTIRASNLGMSAEAGEPSHAGKPGGSSTWFAWTAPATGIATFDTRNSAFDTLLGVYAGASLSSLQPIAGNDDGAENLNSKVLFNVEAGETYHVAIDGLGGAQGYFVLSWSFEPTADRVPAITVHPSSLSVAVGSPAVFSVTAEGEGLGYQWFRNGSPIPWATAASYTNLSVSAAAVGNYTVQVTNRVRRVVASDPAFLEVGAVAALSQDKLEDLLARVGPGGSGLRAFSLNSGAVFISPGMAGSKLLSNRDSTVQIGEPLHGGNIAGASQWVALKTVADGSLRLDTLGSSIDTILAVYTGTSISDLSLVAENDNAEASGQSSRVEFPAQAGQLYLAAIDGAGGQRGPVQLNWQLSSATLAPSISAVPDQRIQKGSPAVTVQIEISDPDTPVSELTVDAVSDNQALIPNAALSWSGTGAIRLLRLSAADQGAGEARIMVSASDGTSTTTRTFVVTVSQEQAAIVIPAIADLTVEEDAPSASVTFWVQSYPPLAGELVASVTSDNPDLAPQENLELVFTNNQGTVSIVPAANRSGAARITVSVTDGVSSAQSSFRLMVTPVNDPPELAIESAVPLIVSSRRQSTEIALAISDPETPAGELILTASSDNQPLFPDVNLSFVRSGPSHVLVLRSAPSATGTAKIDVQVSDGSLSASQSFAITVIEPMLAISPIPDQAIDEDRVAEGIAFSVTSSLPTGKGLTLLAGSGNSSLVPNENIQTFLTNGSGTLRIAPLPDQSGFTRITLSASDGEVTALCSFNLTVSAIDDPPTLALLPAGPQNIAAGGPPLEISLELGDPDSLLDRLELTATSDNQEVLPDRALSLIGSGAQRLLRVTPAPSTAGTVQISVRLSDGNSESVRRLEVTIAPAEPEISISPVADQTLEEDRNSGAITFSIESTSPLGGEITLAVTSDNSELVPESGLRATLAANKGSLSIEPAPNRSGVAGITIRATSGAVAAVCTFNVIVTEVNDPPAISVNAQQPVILKSGTTRVPLLLSDVDDSPEELTLAFGFNNRLIKAENVSVEGSGSDRTLVLTRQFQEAGSASILITCTDSHGASSSRVLKVQIPEQPRISLAARPAGPQLVLSWQSVSGLRYRVQSKKSLDETWADEGEPILATGLLSEAAVEITSSPWVFYRIVLQEEQTELP